jgi:hypothetical protein
MSASKITISLKVVAIAITVVCGFGGAAILLWNGVGEKYLVGIALPAILAPVAMLLLFKSLRGALVAIGLLVVVDWIAEILLIVEDCTHHPCTKTSHIGLVLSAVRLPFIEWLALACACLACADLIKRRAQRSQLHRN